MTYIILFLLTVLFGFQIVILMKKQQPVLTKQDDVFYCYTTLNGHKYILISGDVSTKEDVGYFNVDNYNIDSAIREFKKRKHDSKSISGKI